MTVSGGRMRIGEVHALLRQDYPDIELSKIRYYEDKGLVEPSRSRKGYRLYSERDVACLREAIRLAQEEFVPLRVVRLRLVEQGLLIDASPSPVTKQVARSATAVVSAPVPASPARVGLAPVEPDGADEPAPTQLAELGIDATLLNQVTALALVPPTSRATETVLSDLDLAVAHAAAALLARGVDPRHLSSLRRVVEREVGVIEDATEPLRAPGRRISREQAREVTSAVAGEVEALRAALLERSLRAYLDH